MKEDVLYKFIDEDAKRDFVALCTDNNAIARHIRLAGGVFSVKLSSGSSEEKRYKVMTDSTGCYKGTLTEEETRFFTEVTEKANDSIEINELKTGSLFVIIDAKRPARKYLGRVFYYINIAALEQEYLVFIADSKNPAEIKSIDADFVEGMKCLELPY